MQNNTFFLKLERINLKKEEKEQIKNLNWKKKNNIEYKELIEGLLVSKRNKLIKRLKDKDVNDVKNTKQDKQVEENINDDITDWDWLEDEEEYIAN